ncbi:hypothetical protein [Achromobacter piechaudii]|uniref:hypothetical protein n=1 Tax=Achromobacter piechaudii TaxID=72556 RepID=UPI000772FEA3|nr:hypothetical protein [Achromobacter piechaudii]
MVVDGEFGVGERDVEFGVVGGVVGGLGDGGREDVINFDGVDGVFDAFDGLVELVELVEVIDRVGLGGLGDLGGLGGFAVAGLVGVTGVLGVVGSIVDVIGISLDNGTPNGESSPTSSSMESALSPVGATPTEWGNVTSSGATHRTVSRQGPIKMASSGNTGV